jgi:hypothetical protein
MEFPQFKLEDELIVERGISWPVTTVNVGDRGAFKPHQTPLTTHRIETEGSVGFAIAPQ